MERLLSDGTARPTPGPGGRRRLFLPLFPRCECHTPWSYSSGMGRQLLLLDVRAPDNSEGVGPQWVRLDEASKERGRRGVAAARAALARAVPQEAA